ncbi:hypothetical protein I3842_09G098200 [Carya illinoinensis]|uniref:Bifunctional inhibitor/plant lipid transfer protein/seed storage helical domain-containing protein n=1 Tax=Carya illinoinensis TaxID=32201 RepID=A0A922E2U0_CARIL|nr:hypothetical protein I3842_09G098200 [Carya illinoinensis]
MEKQTILMASGLMMMMLILSATTTKAYLCQAALKALLPCRPFLTGSNPPAPSDSCCLGAHEVLDKATSSQDINSLCACFKNALPNLCKVKVPFPIKPDVNCNKF